MLTPECLQKAVRLTAGSRSYEPQLEALAAIFEFLNPKRYLEVGAFEGRSALLFCLFAALHDPLNPVHLTSVDSWQGGDEHVQGGIAMSQVESSYDETLSLCRDWLHPDSVFEKHKEFSDVALNRIRAKGVAYDLILIDAGHKAKDVLVDMVYAWPLLRAGGVMIVDDYTWVPKHDVNGLLLHSPKVGIDAFCACYADELTILSNMPLLQLYVYKNPPFGKHYQALRLRLPSLPEIVKSSGLI